ncbi:M15 family metallopeptidase [Arthrobacter woluwensis]|uniref:D-alanyl-D-alanine carboxypeptidase n=1 Tax=Arthrobacter woluwensis TaxID=156980 RepID=A0A1H4KVD3_9MICC|nr:M15 family metallopeptidase [Arthrobacter woluwensis]SEB62353.1 D-alanyl-D-alanine carboxypeptidase [Arthrobacter woluwensis]
MFIVRRRRATALAIISAALLAACSAAPVLPRPGGGSAVAVAVGSGGQATAEDGAIPLDRPLGVDSQEPAIARLRADLRDALREASIYAAADGVTLSVSSGWRSQKFQSQLLADATRKYHSQEEAARWVATPETSPHVSGDAVDIAGEDAMSWLSQHGARFGLCQIYSNERWHYEYRAAALRGACPLMYQDPTEDPRMKR